MVEGRWGGGGVAEGKGREEGGREEGRGRGELYITSFFTKTLIDITLPNENAMLGNLIIAPSGTANTPLTNAYLQEMERYIKWHFLLIFYFNF